jgi:hypothetical protein
LAVFLVACVVVAGAVAWWPRDDTIVRVVSTDGQGICVRDVPGTVERCLDYTPEFPSEARYREGECLRFTEVYRADVPPHAERVSCPDRSP